MKIEDEKSASLWKELKLRVNELINIHGIENSALILDAIKEESKFAPYFSKIISTVAQIKRNYCDESQKKGLWSNEEI